MEVQFDEEGWAFVAADKDIAFIEEDLDVSTEIRTSEDMALLNSLSLAFYFVDDDAPHDDDLEKYLIAVGELSPDPAPEPRISRDVEGNPTPGTATTDVADSPIPGPMTARDYEEFVRFRTLREAGLDEQGRKRLTEAREAQMARVDERYSYGHKILKELEQQKDE